MRLRKQMPIRNRVALAVATFLALLPTAWANPKFKVLYRFYAGKYNDGGVWSGLAFDRKGNLYGTTWGGGANGEGTVFEIVRSDKGTWRKKVLHSFDPRTEGNDPGGTLLFDGDTALYGTTSLNGPNVSGTVFQMTRTSGGWTFQVIDDYGSYAGVVPDQVGNLYGSIRPGEYDNGAVAELVHSAGGWTQNYLYSFCAKSGCPDGAIPVSGVVFDGAGNLYGTTEYGGTGKAGGLGGGTAYELQRKPDGTWEHQVLHSFPAFNGDGMLVYAGLVMDKQGNLYGATAQGGAATCGTIFKLTPSATGWSETLLYDFPQRKDGCGPASSLTFDAAGNLYGTAGGGIGDCNGGCGVVFKLSRAARGQWKYSVLHSFQDYDGALPSASVIFDKKGNLYGTTGLGGGGHSVGVVFEITP